MDMIKNDNEDILGIDYRKNNNIDGWAYIDHDDVIVAANTLGRSVISSKRIEDIFKKLGMNKKLYYFSLFFYNRLNSDYETIYKLSIELKLEYIRILYFPEQVSRLQCLYVFDNKNTALQAQSWNNDLFTNKYLRKINMPYIKTRLDSNWITYAENCKIKDWEFRYWNGDTYPDKEPIWEILLDTYFIIEDENLKYDSLKTIEECFDLQERYIFELLRGQNELGNPLGCIMLNGSENENKLCIKPVIIPIHNKDNKRIDKFIDYLPLPDTPKEFVLYDRNMIRLPDLNCFNKSFEINNDTMNILDLIFRRKEKG